MRCTRVAARFQPPTVAIEYRPTSQARRKVYEISIEPSDLALPAIEVVRVIREQHRDFLVRAGASDRQLERMVRHIQAAVSQPPSTGSVGGGAAPEAQVPGEHRDCTRASTESSGSKGSKGACSRYSGREDRWRCRLGPMGLDEDEDELGGTALLESIVLGAGEDVDEFEMSVDDGALHRA